MKSPDVPDRDETPQSSREWLRRLVKEFLDPLCPSSSCLHPRSEHASDGCRHFEYKVDRGYDDVYRQSPYCCVCKLSVHEININVMMRARDRLALDDVARRERGRNR